MYDINNEKNKSSVILNPERSEWVSRSHVTSVESVVNDGVKTKRYSAKRDLYGDFAYAQPLKMTGKALSFLRLRGASGAQGISAPASCREAHKRRFLFNSWILRFANASLRMTFPVLALIFDLATTTESRADNPSGTCGTNCNWVFDGDTLKITGGSNGEIGTMTEYGYKTINGVYGIYDSSDKSRPWIEYQDQIKKIDIQGVANVGSLAFDGFSKVTDIKLDDTIKTISQYAFSRTNAQTIVLPDSITKVDVRAFSGSLTVATSLKQLIIPDSVNFIGNSAFGANNEQLQNLEIICKGDQAKCVSTLSKYEYYDSDDGTVKYIPMNLASHMSVADYNYCASTNFYWNGVNCIREPDLSKRKCCADVCKDMGGYCNRIRYTPAEAAEVLKDDNNNSVTITFKK